MFKSCFSKWGYIFVYTLDNAQCDIDIFLFLCMAFSAVYISLRFIVIIFVIWFHIMQYNLIILYFTSSLFRFLFLILICILKPIPIPFLFLIIASIHILLWIICYNVNFPCVFSKVKATTNVSRNSKFHTNQTSIVMKIVTNVNLHGCDIFPVMSNFKSISQTLDELYWFEKLKI